MTIYLDHAATTPLDPRVAAAMAECLADPQAQGNPASATHGAGLAARERVEAARAAVAQLIGAAPAEIIFTSGATESNNLALLGVARAARRAAAAGRTAARTHVISARTEHRSVLDTCAQLERDGFTVTLVEPDESGRVPAEAIATALRPETLLVSLMLVNNEIGVINDVGAVAALAAARDVLVHSDASQALGKLPVDVHELRVDFLSFTAHKFYGPKGIGALYVREAARPHIAPVQFGGGHERGLRSGTLPTHQAVGFGLAAALARNEQGRDAAHARDLAARLERELEEIPGVRFNSRRGDGVPGLVNASFDGVEGESLITGLPEIAVSTGSACSSASREASYVLRALGRSTELAQSSLRLSLGRFSSAADVDLAATAIRAEVARLRAIAGNPDGPAKSRLDPDSSLASGNTLLGRSLNAVARRYFLAAPRPPHLPSGDFAGRTEDGTAVRFELQIDDGTVKSARFSAYGCPHTLAVAGWLCETLEGQKVERFSPGSPAEWAEKFAVPAEKLGRLLVVEDAMRAALSSTRRV